MTVPFPAQAFPGRILAVTLPAGPGGAAVTVGGQNALPLLPEGDHPNGAAVGMEVRTDACDLPPSLRTVRLTAHRWDRDFEIVVAQGVCRHGAAP